MARNSYIGLAMLGTHPAFSLRDGLLHCPSCPEVFSRTHEYDAHYLAHKPTITDAERFLSAKTFRREQRRGRWMRIQEEADA